MRTTARPVLFDGGKLLEESFIVVVFSEDLLVACSDIFIVENLAKLLAVRLSGCGNKLKDLKEFYKVCADVSYSRFNHRGAKRIPLSS